MRRSPPVAPPRISGSRSIRSSATSVRSSSSRIQPDIRITRPPGLLGRPLLRPCVRRRSQIFSRREDRKPPEGRARISGAIRAITVLPRAHLHDGHAERFQCRGVRLDIQGPQEHGQGDGAHTLQNGPCGERGDAGIYRSKRTVHARPARTKTGKNTATSSARSTDGMPTGTNCASTRRPAPYFCWHPRMST